jgi:hypothetical protein
LIDVVFALLNVHLRIAVVPVHELSPKVGAVGFVPEDTGHWLCHRAQSAVLVFCRCDASSSKTHVLPLQCVEYLLQILAPVSGQPHAQLEALQVEVGVVTVTVFVPQITSWFVTVFVSVASMV